MKKVLNFTVWKWISGVFACSVLLLLTGCKTAATPEQEAVAVQEDTVEEPAPLIAREQPDPAPETIAPVKNDGDAGLPPAATADTGPGDGPPPRDHVNNKLEEMEDSLATLQAVPAK